MTYKVGDYIFDRRIQSIRRSVVPHAVVLITDTGHNYRSYLDGRIYSFYEGMFVESQGRDLFS